LRLALEMSLKELKLEEEKREKVRKASEGINSNNYKIDTKD
jgi:hypothetical protein